MGAFFHVINILQKHHGCIIFDWMNYHFYFPFIIWRKFGSFPLYITMNNALQNLCIIFVKTYISFFSDIHLFAELLAGSYDETTFNISRNWWSFTFFSFSMFTLFELFSFENYHLFLILPVIFFPLLLGNAKVFQINFIIFHFHQ